MCHDQQRAPSLWAYRQVATIVKSTWTETTRLIKYVFTDCMGKVQCLQQVVSVMSSVLAFFTALTAITLMLAGFKTKCDIKV